jgi:hypothetical protein
MNPAYLRWNEAYREGHVDRDEDPEEEPHLPRRAPLPKREAPADQAERRIELHPTEEKKPNG